ncbi:hypothetical protein DL768_005589 [Monosporascus sp. mg162]|nr:hypothetical protein DL768_005589 [Monosporascus sp. mg162]
MAKKNKKGKKKPKQQDGKDPEQSAKVNPQTGSLLFQRLPQEIRDHIWTQLFYSTRFTFGERPTGRIGRVKIKPAPNGLALLRTCRRAQLEIGDSWLRHVLFCFENIEAMLDKLSALSVDTLSKLRHMRVSGDTLMLSYPDDDVFYRLVSALKLLPGLQLDQLTVLGGRGIQVNYGTLGGLIKDGNGWKTLRYICYSSAMLGFPSEHNISHPMANWEAQPEYWRKPQPKHWQTVMEGRDGVASNPSVTVYRAKEPALYGSIVDPSRRVKFEQKPHHGQDLRADMFPADPELMAGDEQKKELMVIVKRGSGVNYEEKRDSPFIESDIRRDLPEMTWKQIRALCIDNPFDDEDEEERWPPGDEEDDPAEADVYKDVDEYIWTPLHFNLDL